MEKNKKILITGGAGFIGSNLIQKLLEKNYKITILDDFSSGFKKNLFEFESKINIVEGDINDFSLVENLIKDTKAVFHLAAMVSVLKSIEKPLECIQTNLKASLNLILLCIKYNSKFIFASSAAVYGENKSNIKTEDLIISPISPYGISKFDVEKFCEIYYKNSKLKYVCFRNFNVYGPKQDIKSSYAAAIPSFISKAIKNENLIIYGDGNQTRDFIYVQDIVNAYVEALDEKIIGVFNLGCNEVISIKDLSKFILKEINSNSKIIYKEERNGDIKHSRASSEKYIKNSNWNSNFLLSDGIKKTIEYYKKNEEN